MLLVDFSLSWLICHPLVCTTGYKGVTGLTDMGSYRNFVCSSDCAKIHWSPHSFLFSLIFTLLLRHSCIANSKTLPKGKSLVFMQLAAGCLRRPAITIDNSFAYLSEDKEESWAFGLSLQTFMQIWRVCWDRSGNVCGIVCIRDASSQVTGWVVIREGSGLWSAFSWCYIGKTGLCCLNQPCEPVIWTKAGLWRHLCCINCPR